MARGPRGRVHTPPGTPERRRQDDPGDGEPPEGESRRISDELLWLRHAIEEPEASGLTPLPESAAVGMWDAEDACLKRLCRLRDRKVLDAAGFLLHESDDPDELLGRRRGLAAIEAIASTARS